MGKKRQGKRGNKQNKELKGRKKRSIYDIVEK